MKEKSVYARSWEDSNLYECSLKKCKWKGRSEDKLKGKDGFLLCPKCKKNDSFYRLSEQTMQDRIDIVNQIIVEIANRGTGLFMSSDNVLNKTSHSFLFYNEKSKKLYLKKTNGTEILIVKKIAPPHYWDGGQQTWNLTLEFLDFIKTGKEQSSSFVFEGYSEKETKEIQDKAKELHYL